MTRKKKERTTPGKMTDFFSLSDRYSCQDGVGRMQSPSLSHNQKACTGWMAGTSPQLGSTQKLPASQASSSANSPAKTRQRMSQHTPPAAEEGDRGIGIDDTLEFQHAIDAFPTNNQPVMDSKLKEMLVSLRGAIHTDMLQLMKQCKSEVKLGTRYPT